MATVSGFPPVCNANADTLILGSMPGIASLNATEYYAHPRNAFWKVIEAIFGIDSSLAYHNRITALQNTNLALWDVLQQCKRQGSLDSAIEANSVLVNDFAQFFEQHPSIQRIVFNGKTAEKTFKRDVMPQLKTSTKDLAVMRLVSAPSTSPAHAIPLSDKIAAWRIALSH